MYALSTDRTVQGPVRLIIWVTLTANLFRNYDLHKDTRRCLSTKHIVSDPYNTNMGLCVGWILLRPRKEQKCRQAPSTARALCVYGSNSLESCACSYGITQSIMPGTGAPCRDVVQGCRVLYGEAQKLEKPYCSAQNADNGLLSTLQFT